MNIQSGPDTDERDKPENESGRNGRGSEKIDEYSFRHGGAIVPSVLFDQETVDAVNWKNVYGF